MKTPHKHTELIKAWADGAKIQYWSVNHEHWADCQINPQWEVNKQYRVKPETITVTLPKPCGWSSRTDLTIAIAFDSEEAADDARAAIAKAIKS